MSGWSLGSSMNGWLAGSWPTWMNCSKPMGSSRIACNVLSEIFAKTGTGMLTGGRWRQVTAMAVGNKLEP